ncbi:MAG: Bax inhibitor-1/YccA family protein [Actinomycetota bacterium]|nr:Bax inhibitor-1/YccA family protein [Actinomycetota bacterium]
MPSNNPAFRNMQKVIGGQQAPSADYLQQMYNQPSATGYGAPAQQRYLTLDDVVARTATLLGTAIVAGVITAYLKAYVLTIPALVIGLVLSLVIIFKRSSNPALILGYAVAEGVLLGAITGVFEGQWPGIAMQAIIGTVGVFAGMLVVYKTGVIRVTPKFTKVLLGAMIGVIVLMAANLLVGMFGGNLHLRDGGTLSIIFSIVCIVIAAFSFMLDFETIHQAIKGGAPASTAWYFSFGLMVTLVWLYLEILRLLGYMRSN